MRHWAHRLWKYLTCCAWQKRVLVYPGNWMCKKCRTVHLY